jgi:hypothetical protein
LVGPEAVKALKGQLEALTSARAQVASNPLCGHVAAGLDQQIAGVRAQLAAAQPLEVALRGTLGGVTQARQSLARAEQKAAKLESQVVTALAAYDVAAAEVAECQKQLADAEAATARIAGGRFDPRLLLGAHPGAALEVLSEAAAARCTVGSNGVDSALASRVQAAFQEVLAVCRLLPAEVPAKAEAEGAPHSGSPPVAIAKSGATEATEVVMGEDASGGGSRSSGSDPSDAVAGHGCRVQLLHHLPQSQPHSTGQQQHADAQQQQQQAILQPAQQQQPQQQPPQQPPVPVVATINSAEDAIEWAAQQHHQQEQLQQRQAQLQAEAAAAEQGLTAAAQLQHQQQLAVQAAATAALVDGTGAPVHHHAAGAHAASDPSQPGQGNLRDDAMGGGASDNVAGKRSASAIASARTLAAKAKARAS